MLESIRIISLYMAPFMPETSKIVYDALGQGSVEDVKDIKTASAWGGLKPDTEIKMTDALFPRLKEDEIDFSLE